MKKKIFNSIIFIIIFLNLIVLTKVLHADTESYNTKVNGNMRLRGIYLQSGIAVKLMELKHRQALALSENDNIYEEKSFTDMRFRLKITQKINSNLIIKGHIELGDIIFGLKNTGGGIGSDQRIVELKGLSMIYETSLKTVRFEGGLFPATTPGKFILGNDAAGIKLNFSRILKQTDFKLTFLKAVENSKTDLNCDGLIDNNFNDRDIFIGELKSTIFTSSPLTLTYVYDIDNSNGYDYRFNCNSSMINPEYKHKLHTIQFGYKFNKWLISINLNGIYQFGNKSFPTIETSNKNTINQQNVSAFGFFGNISFPIFTLDTNISYSYASTDKSETNETSNTLTIISPDFQMSNILCDTFGGYSLFNGNPQNLQMVKIDISTILIGISVKATLASAWLTGLTKRNDSQIFTSKSNHLGNELNVNLKYYLTQNFSFFSRNGIVLPEKGMQSFLDSNNNNPIFEIMAGSQVTF